MCFPVSAYVDSLGISVVYREEKAPTMYENYDPPILFPLSEMYKMFELDSESKRAEIYTQGEIRIFIEWLLCYKAAQGIEFCWLLYFRESPQGYLKAPNHLSFYSLLDFCESRQIHLKAPNHFRFSLNLCFGES